ncbi:MAG TPA: enoyl-CoA hydratase-related protein [Burkholderiaceae bacterium]|nr:enoyl-CoA hydratase-related protein [Burkholderiaceae bacterium]
MPVLAAPADAEGIARLTLANPGKLNALSAAMWRELRAGVERVVADAATRVVVVAGEGGQFASGGDIEEFPSFRFDAASLARFHEEDVLPALAALRDCELPLVAQIDGACIGGGLEIAACCDIRIAGAGSRFGVPIARLGFPMAPAELEVVVAVVGPTVLRELLIEARVLDALEARARGLVTRVVPDDQVAAEALAAARRIARLSPQAVRLNKRTLREFARPPLSLAAAREPYYHYAPSDEHREGLAAFIEKREPRFP